VVKNLVFDIPRDEDDSSSEEGEQKQQPNNQIITIGNENPTTNVKTAVATSSSTTV
jgi:hypothetical protein